MKKEDFFEPKSQEEAIRFTALFLALNESDFLFDYNPYSLEGPKLSTKKDSVPSRSYPTGYHVLSKVPGQVDMDTVANAISHTWYPAGGVLLSGEFVEHALYIEWLRKYIQSPDEAYETCPFRYRKPNGDLEQLSELNIYFIITNFSSGVHADQQYWENSEFPNEWCCHLLSLSNLLIASEIMWPHYWLRLSLNRYLLDGILKSIDAQKDFLPWYRSNESILSHIISQGVLWHLSGPRIQFYALARLAQLIHSNHCFTSRPDIL